MGRTATPLQYRAIVRHNGVLIQVKNVNGVAFYGIQYPNGDIETRKAGSGLQRFNGKVLARDNAAFGPMCRYCGVRLATTIDHIVPWSIVGDYENAANVAACCKECNASMGAHEHSTTKTRELVARLLAENWELGRRS